MSEISEAIQAERKAYMETTIIGDKGCRICGPEVSHESEEFKLVEAATEEIGKLRRRVAALREVAAYARHRDGCWQRSDGCDCRLTEAQIAEAESYASPTPEPAMEKA